MKKLLRHAWFIGGVLEYDTDTGRILNMVDKEWKNWDDSEISSGCVWKKNGKAFAWYLEGEDRIFQSGARKWSIQEDVKTQLLNFIFFRNFKIIRNGRVEFNIWYKPAYIALSFLDPTHDVIDAESDDHFLSIHNSFKFFRENH